MLTPMKPKQLGGWALTTAYVVSIVFVAGFFFVPIGTWWVDSRYVHGVSCLGEHFGHPEACARERAGIEIHSETETLTAFGYFKAKRSGALYGKYRERTDDERGWIEIGDLAPGESATVNLMLGTTTQ